MFRLLPTLNARAAIPVIAVWKAGDKISDTSDIRARPRRRTCSLCRPESKGWLWGRFIPLGGLILDTVCVVPTLGVSWLSL